MEERGKRIWEQVTEREKTRLLTQTIMCTTCVSLYVYVNAIFHVGSTQSRVRETTFLHQKNFRCEFDARNCFTSNRKCTGARLIHRSWNRFIIINQHVCARPSDSVKVDNILILSYINIGYEKRTVMHTM